MTIPPEENLRLNSFLAFGYFMDYRPEEAETIDLRAAEHSYAACTDQELIHVAAAHLQGAVSRSFIAGKTNVVPLSGGLDSRLLLELLLKHCEARNIRSYTFGTPGTFDFEIGKEVAQQYGVTHDSIPLDQYRYDTATMVETATAFDLQARVYYGPPVKALLNRYQHCRVWSGYLGDVIAGSHVPKHPIQTLEAAKIHFVRKETMVRSIRLSRIPDERLVQLIDHLPQEKSGTLSYEELLDYRNRQVKLIAKCVMHRGLDFVAPYMDPELIAFFVTLPKHQRRKRHLFKKVMLNIFPKSCQQPTKLTYGLPLDAGPLHLKFRCATHLLQNTIGRRLGLTDRHLNFLDFGAAIRIRVDVRKSIHENLQDLKSRKLLDWVDPLELWAIHNRGQQNLTDALIVLASLEILLKAGAIISQTDS